MRALKIIVIVNGVLIVAVLAVFAVVFTREATRLPVADAAWTARLDLPAGAAIAGVTAVGDLLAVHVRDGGAGRVVVLDPRTGRIAGTAGP